MATSVLPVVLCLYVIYQVCTAQNCGLRANLPLSLNDNFPGEESVLKRITVNQQAIIPTYKFSCQNQMCGNITKWGVDVFRSGFQHQGTYTIDFQVWRPSPTVDDFTGAGCYSLVGNNRFTSISLSGGVAVVTPLPENYVQFRDGDVLGLYVEEGLRNSDGVVILNSDSYDNERVWLASINPSSTYPSGNCPYTVGNAGELNTLVTGAPVLSISTETFSCPSSSVVSTNPTLDPSPPPTVITVGSEATPTTDDGDQNKVLTFTGPLTSEGDTDTTAEDSGLITGISALIMAVIISVSVIVSLMLIVTTTCIIIVKRKRRRMNGFNVVDSGAAFSNQVYMNRSSAVFETTYESVESPPKSSTTKPIPSVDYDTASEKVPSDPLLSGASDEGKPNVDYHDVGPNISKPPELPARRVVGAQVHGENESENIYHYAETQPSYDQLERLDHEPLSLSISTGGAQRSKQTLDIFDTAGIYVPTAEQRATWDGHYVMQDSKTYHKLKFFDEDKVYWAPATTTSDLYIQLSSKKYREIPRNQITISSQLGSGQFGEVCQAQWSVSGTTKDLAIKTLKTGSKEEEKVRFLQEAAIMGQFSHPNVVRLYGVVTVGDPVMICLELMANGDLREYLMSSIPGTKNSRELETQFLRFSKQIASGMNHLGNKSFIHRDLAARNILLDETLTCKVGDFGMARDLMDDTYYTATKGAKIPIKWTAPEALLYKKYSTDSDVWSYGMVLFEIWSVGKKPFSRFSNSEVVRQINTGYNQPPPPGCPRAIYQLMVNCWHPQHSKRPSFSEVLTYLNTSKELLFQWVEEADKLSSGAKKIGASLSEAESLYKDLQNVYLIKLNED